MRALSWAALAAAASIAGCGGEYLRRPMDLPVRTFSTGEAVTLTVVMSNCSRSCERFQPATCEVEVNESERLIRINPEVEFEREGDCELACTGPAVVARCEVGSIAAGEWTVRTDGGVFSRTITVE